MNIFRTLSPVFVNLKVFGFFFGFFKNYTEKSTFNVFVVAADFGANHHHMFVIDILISSLGKQSVNNPLSDI